MGTLWLRQRIPQSKTFGDAMRQNPSSGGGAIKQIWTVVSGERLDTIAYQVYKDATRWREIAEHNQLVNPNALRPGDSLIIPH